ncbi:unnamed protein product, partial [Mesorhabditis spiculigera]
MPRAKYRINRRKDSVELDELRKSGVPWLIAAILILLLAIFGLTVYYFLRNEREGAELAALQISMEARIEYIPRPPEHRQSPGPFPEIYQNQSLINILLSSLPIDTARKLERRFYGKAEMRSNQQLRWHFAYVLWNLIAVALGEECWEQFLKNQPALHIRSMPWKYQRKQLRKICLMLNQIATLVTNPFLYPVFCTAFGQYFEGFLPELSDGLSTFAFLNQKPNASVVDFTLAETMRRLATTRDPVQLFYRGDIANQIIREMKQNGGILQKSDFVNYVSHVSRISSDSINNMHIFGPHRPAATSYILLVLSVLQESLKNSTDLSPDKFFHRLLEAEKFSLGRLQEVADPRFSVNHLQDGIHERLARKISDFVKVPPYYGRQLEQTRQSASSFLAVVDRDGNAAALGLSLGSGFGAMKRSEQLGIVWNNGLDGFSDPESANSLEPRKRAKSLMCPLIRSDDKASPSSPFLLKV